MKIGESVKKLPKSEEVELTYNDNVNDVHYVLTCKATMKGNIYSLYEVKSGAFVYKGSKNTPKFKEIS